MSETNVDLVIYHANCSDGFGAAYAAHKVLGGRAIYYAAFHGDPPPDVKGKNVVIADFSYDLETTKKLIDEAASLVILDHHKTAKERLGDLPNLHFDNGHSGAILSWNYFHPGKEPPRFLKYIEDRDLWKWELPYSKEFAAAFDMIQWTFEDFELFEDDSVVDDAIQRGKYILAYSKTVIKKICEKAQPRKWHGKSVMLVNSSHWQSEIGNKLAQDCDIAIIWYYSHETHKSRVSCRAFHDKVDVTEIAQMFGGGGHKKAAGFELPEGIHIESIFDKE